MFILPKKIIRDMTCKFNRFLWNGEDGHSARAKEAWDDICFPTKEGGLGLKCLDTWHKTFMLRHIWTLFARFGSLWVARIRIYLLKGRSFWNLSIPQDCSWSWRKLLNLRSFAREHLKFEVGPGHSIHLWHENWHPLGPLHEKFGLGIIYDSQSISEARVSSVIKNGEWFWKPAQSEDLVILGEI
jgi:hypothetical protein